MVTVVFEFLAFQKFIYLQLEAACGFSRLNLLHIVSMIISETIIDRLIYHNLWVLLLPIFVESTVS